MFVLLVITKMTLIISRLVILPLLLKNQSFNDAINNFSFNRFPRHARVLKTTKKYAYVTIPHKKQTCKNA